MAVGGWLWKLWPHAAAPAASDAVREFAIEMGAPFQDHAILQRGMKVPVWGWSKPGTMVTVAFAGQSKTATAGGDGKFMLEFDPLKASAESAEMVITESGGKTETLSDIVVGEVWLASGRSNMQYPVNRQVTANIPMEILARVKEGKETMPIIREVAESFNEIIATEVISRPSEGVGRLLATCALDEKHIG